MADSDTISILSLARKISDLSEEAFDITVFPLIRLWRKAAKMKTIPRYEELEKARSLVCFQDLTIHSDTRVSLQHSGQGIDLGGIGKGYAVNRARDLYCEAGVRYYLHCLCK